MFSCQEEGNLSVENSNNHSNIFVGSETCKSCHQKEFQEWKNSDHDLSMQQADSTTVLADFNNVNFKSKGINYRFFKKDEKFYVHTEGESGVYKNYNIVFTFGIRPLQQYLIEFPNGKYQLLAVAWDTQKRAWYDLRPNTKFDHQEWMHWTGGSMNWNSMCADCHSTKLHKNYNASQQSYQTKYSIINVSCEACHGPSSSHVGFYENNKNNKHTSPPKLYMDSSTSPKELVQKCARCHSRRTQLTNNFDFKGDFLDHYNPSLITNRVYELDGQILDEDYVYGSFIQSKMYHNEVSCADCHNVHTLALKEKGNALCLTCHEPKYNDYAHHFHPTNSEAAQCVNCHMTGKIYMGNDFRRDHSFRNPRPDQSQKYGTPNACNNCHKDESSEWASNVIKTKFGEKRPTHFSDDLLAGFYNNKNALFKSFSNTSNPAIIRATAISQYTNQTLINEEITNLVNYLQDSAALVRNATIIALGAIDYVDVSEYVKPLLKDSVRLVRITAAQYFNRRNKNLADSTKAQKEYLDFLAVNADFASGQHQIALYHQAKGAIENAIKAYERAIEIDNYYNQSRINLALLKYQSGDVEAAEDLYLKVVEQEPASSYPYYMLGLLYNEKGASKNALKYLSLACEKQPVLPRAFYNYGIKLQEQGLYNKSITVIDKALKSFPLDEDLLYIKLLGQIKANQKKEAKKTCTSLLKISPNNVRYKEIFQNLE